MVKRRRGFVEKLLCTCVGYIHMKVTPQIVFWYCAHIQEILIVFYQTCGQPCSLINDLFLYFFVYFHLFTYFVYVQTFIDFV